MITLEELLGPNFALIRAWARDVLGIDEFDAFISYRWGVDDTLSALLYDLLTRWWTIRSDNRGIRVFRDKKVLKMGDSFVVEMCKKLIHSKLIIILLSTNAIERLRTGKFDPTKVDNTLLEWVLAIICYEIVEFRNMK